MAFDDDDRSPYDFIWSWRWWSKSLWICTVFDDDDRHPYDVIWFLTMIIEIPSNSYGFWRWWSTSLIVVAAVGATQGSDARLSEDRGSYDKMAEAVARWRSTFIPNRSTKDRHKKREERAHNQPLPVFMLTRYFKSVYSISAFGKVREFQGRRVMAKASCFKTIRTHDFL